MLRWYETHLQFFGLAYFGIGQPFCKVNKRQE